MTASDSMGRRIFVVSDLHLGHANIIKYCDRPFASVEEMDEALVANWNAVVTPQDIIYNCGDVYFGDGWKHVPRLNGHKRLIVGNHDDAKDPRLTKYHEKVLAWRMFPEYHALLTHVPVHYSVICQPRRDGPPRTLCNVHGHVHRNNVKCGGVWRNCDDENYRNVSVENIGYTPVLLQDVIPWQFLSEEDREKRRGIGTLVK